MTDEPEEQMQGAVDHRKVAAPIQVRQEDIMEHEEQQKPALPQGEFAKTEPVNSVWFIDEQTIAKICPHKQETMGIKKNLGTCIIVLPLF